MMPLRRRPIPRFRSLAAKQARMRQRWKQGNPLLGWWKWECPTCHRFGFVRDKPTFFRCYPCDSRIFGEHSPRLTITQVKR